MLFYHIEARIERTGEAMLVRFYFDLMDDVELIRDDEGVDADTLEQAWTVARAVVAEMRADDEIVPHDRDWQILIRDENGVIRERIALG